MITYIGLPAQSGGAHVLRGKDISKHWEATHRFLRECTNFTAPTEIQVRLDHGPDTPEEFSAPIIAQLTELFGPPRTPPPFAGTIEEHALWWYPPLEAVPSLIAWMKAKQPFPDHPYGSPLSLGFEAARLKLLEPGTREVMPFQGADEYVLQTTGEGGLLGETLLFLRLGTDSSLFLVLSFPYQEPTPAFNAHVAFLQERLPFRLSSAHWKRWRINKPGTHYRGIRLRLEDGSAYSPPPRSALAKRPKETGNA